jgi:hypothetical protein
VATTDARSGPGPRGASARPVGVAALADGPRSGHVTAFDDRRGLGIVETSVGERLPFHCVALLDGTRKVEVGTPVRCAVAAGVLGRWEAADIATDVPPDGATPAGPPPSPAAPGTGSAAAPS